MTSGGPDGVPGPIAPLRSDRGSAPAAALAWVGTTAVLVAALALLGQGVVAQARAATAADLSALAAADALAVGGDDPCAVAAEVATANGARLVACSVVGQDVVLTSSVVAGPLPPAQATARAGPCPVQSGSRSLDGPGAHFEERALTP